MKLSEKMKNIFLDKTFMLFILIGCINTLNGVLFSYLYSKLLNENLAFILGYVSGIIIAYALNSFITFKEGLSFVKFIKYVISYLPNFIIQNVIVILVFNILNLNKLIAYTLAAIIGTPVTFILLKFYAFKKGN